MEPIKAESDNTVELPPPLMVDAGLLRWMWMGLGLIMAAIGIVGVFLPVLPTTVFFIVALWAFSRSSRKFQIWLWTHPTFGPPLRNWYQYRVISPKAKILAVTMMSISFIYVAVWVAEGWRLTIGLAAVMVPTAIYLLTRKSHAPTHTPHIAKID